MKVLLFLFLSLSAFSQDLLLADRGEAPAISEVYMSVSGRYVDITFDKGVYADITRVNPVTTSNFSITNFSTSSGASALAILSVKRNTHNVSASALSLIGGETVVRIFLTITGTVNSTETFTVQCTDIFSGEYVKSSPVTGTIKLNMIPLHLWDYMATAAVTRTGLGVSEIKDIGSNAAGDFGQTNDGNRPIDGMDFMGFNSTIPNHMTAGNLSTVDFQKTDNFTILIKRLNCLTNHSGYIISNRGPATNQDGWSVQVGADGSIFLAMHDGTNQGFADYDAFCTTGETDLVFMNDSGTLSIKDAAGSTLGATGSTAAVGTITYTSLNLLAGRRTTDSGPMYNGTWEKIAIYNVALTTDQIVDFFENASE